MLVAGMIVEADNTAVSVDKQVVDFVYRLVGEIVDMEYDDNLIVEHHKDFRHFYEDQNRNEMNANHVIDVNVIVKAVVLDRTLPEMIEIADMMNRVCHATSCTSVCRARIASTTSTADAKPSS